MRLLQLSRICSSPETPRITDPSFLPSTCWPQQPEPASLRLNPTPLDTVHHLWRWQQVTAFGQATSTSAWDRVVPFPLSNRWISATRSPRHCSARAWLHSCPPCTCWRLREAATAMLNWMLKLYRHHHLTSLEIQTVLLSFSAEDTEETVLVVMVGGMQELLYEGNRWVLWVVWFEEHGYKWFVRKRVGLWLIDSCAVSLCYKGWWLCRCPACWNRWPLNLCNELFSCICPLFHKQFFRYCFDFVISRHLWGVTLEVALYKFVCTAYRLCVFKGMSRFQPPKWSC